MAPPTATLTPNAVLAVSRHVDAMASGGTLCLFDAATGRASALNRTAADVFTLIDGTTTLGELVHTLATAYQVDANNIATSIVDLVAELCAEGLVTVETSQPT